MMATMDDAHREWHLNAGVPMGTPGRPQDACHLPDPYYCEVDDCLEEAVPCQCGALHCADHPHIPNVGTDGPAPGQCECGNWWCTTEHLSDAQYDAMREAWADGLPF